MARTTAPLLSFGASGQIAKTQVYSTWRGIPYVRRHVIPSNPQTSEQTLTRSAFAWLQNVYKYAGPLWTAAWHAYATGQQFTDRNAFTKINLPDLRPATDLATLVASPGNLGGIPMATVVGSGAAAHLVVTATAPASVPTGWTLTSVILAAILDQDPQSDIDYATFEFEDTTDPYTHDFTPVAAGDYRIFAWGKWTRPDGRIAYSPSIGASRTVT